MGSMRLFQSYMKRVGEGTSAREGDGFFALFTVGYASDGGILSRPRRYPDGGRQ